MERDVDGADRESSRAVPPLPTLQGVDGDRLSQAHPGILLPRLLAAARDRLEWASAELAAQCEEQGLAGVVGRVYGVTPQGERVALREEVRALVALEAEERDRVAALAKDIARLGLDSGQALRDAATMLAAAMRSMVRELGLDEQQDPVLRAMRRAMMVARQAAGHPEHHPDQIGSLPTAAERVAVLRAALAVAERQAAEVEAVEALPEFRVPGAGPGGR